MPKTEAIESKRGLPYQQIFEELRAETVDVIRPIEGTDLRDVVTVLCSGLDHRLLHAESSPLRTGLIRAFNSMNIKEFGFNLTDSLVVQLLNAGVDAGLIDVNERLWFYGIATKQEPKYPDLTLRDIVAYFEPELINIGEWTELNHDGGKLFLTLTQALPESSLVRIEASESIDAENWTAFKRISHFYDVSDAGLYSADIPRTNLKRRIRWRGEYYRVTGSVVGA